MKIEQIPCDPRSYGGLRTGPVEYLVIHYTGNDGDTARNNGIYFSRNVLRASAHWFVDELEWVESVPEDHVAWHVGAASYVHPRCRNGNSIGIELCSVLQDGKFVFRPGTVDNAVKLTRKLMAQYGIPVERVLRHHDVTGKCCPAPFVEDQRQWKAFLDRLTEPQDFAGQMEAWLRELGRKNPGEWSREARAWAEKTGLVQGDGQGMRYGSPVTREELVTILYRMKNKEETNETQ